MYNNLTDKFEKLVQRYMSIIEKHLKERLSIAKDWEFVTGEISREANLMENMLSSPKKAEELTKDFLLQYKNGISMENIVADLRNRYGMNEELLHRISDLGKPLQVIWGEEDEQGNVTRLASDKRQLLKFLVQFMTVQQLKQRLPDLLSAEQAPVKNEHIYPVQWTANRDNKTEFVQLIYALHEAGYLNNGTGEITKIVESLADTLSVSLSKNWQSNLSASIHKSNSDYQPPIFAKIATAYTVYADRLITAKKNNK